MNCPNLENNSVENLVKLHIFYFSCPICEGKIRQTERRKCNESCREKIRQTVSNSDKSR